MNTKLIVGALTVLTGSQLLTASPAAAGNREWATAGKILTGVVVGQVLFNGLGNQCNDQRTVYVERYTTYGYPPPPPPPPVYQEYRRTYYCPPPPPCPPPRGPIVVYQDADRRLYQPPVRGHPAVVQEWSACEDRWVYMEGQPSVY